MKRACVSLAAAFALLLTADVVRAQTLAYSFESPAVNPDGFGPNGGGVTIAQSTTGVTEGSSSLSMSVVAGATFVGALTGNVAAPINDPPGVQAILFDLTITDPFTTGFALIGVTVFGASQPGDGQQFGLQAQFADFESIDGKAAGTYNDVRIDLASATHPLTFATGQSFNQIMGTVGSGANDIIPTGFQFFLNKSNTAPVTVYIDNVRVVGIPEPATLGMAGAPFLALLAWRRRATRVAV
jgi:hypothetical protein